MKSVRSLAALAVMSLGMVGAASAQLLVNGGFEDTGGATAQGWGGYTYGAGYSSPLPGWTVSGNVDIVPLAPWVPPKEGTKSLDLVGFAQGSISQTFATVENAAYTLTFWYSKNVASSPNPSQAEVELTGIQGGTWSQIVSVTDAMAGGPNNMLWTGFSKNFVAAGSQATLSFSDVNGANSGGVFIDAVSVVPEPEAYGLALAGVGVVGWFHAKRRRPGNQNPVV